jgi:hypothetical protein
MWLRLVTNVNLDKNEDEKYTYTFLVASPKKWKCNCFYDLKGDS